MAFTVTNAIERARLTFPECDATTALLLLNDEWTELCNTYDLRDDELWLALTANDYEQALAETAVRIEKAFIYTDAISNNPLDLMNKEESDRMSPKWRTADTSTPSKYYIGSEISADTGIITFAVHPTPNQSTLVVSGATNASPIVVTTTTAHGLSDGDAVRPINVGGNTAANALGYANVLTTTTFEMYSDSDLTTAIAGNGAYTSGGHVITISSPGIRLFIRRSSTFTSDDNIPNRFPSVDVLAYGTALRIANAWHPIEVIQRQEVLYRDALHRFEGFDVRREEGGGAIIQPSHYRSRRVV